MEIVVIVEKIAAKWCSTSHFHVNNKGYVQLHVCM